MLRWMTQRKVVASFQEEGRITDDPLAAIDPGRASKKIYAVSRVNPLFADHRLSPARKSTSSGYGGSSHGHADPPDGLTTIPEGVVPPRPIWPEDHIPETEPGSNRESPNESECASMRDALAELLEHARDVIGLRLRLGEDKEEDEALRCVHERLDRGLAAVRRSAEADIRRLSLCISNSDRVGAVVRAFGSSGRRNRSGEFSVKSVKNEASSEDRFGVKRAKNGNSYEDHVGRNCRVRSQNSDSSDVHGTDCYLKNEDLGIREPDFRVKSAQNASFIGIEDHAFSIERDGLSVLNSNFRGKNAIKDPDLRIKNKDFSAQDPNFRVQNNNNPEIKKSKDYNFRVKSPHFSEHSPYFISVDNEGFSDIKDSDNEDFSVQDPNFKVNNANFINIKDPDFRVRDSSFSIKSPRSSARSDVVKHPDFSVKSDANNPDFSDESNSDFCSTFNSKSTTLNPRHPSTINPKNTPAFNSSKSSINPKHPSIFYPKISSSFNPKKSTVSLKSPTSFNPKHASNSNLNNSPLNSQNPCTFNPKNTSNLDPNNTTFKTVHSQYIMYNPKTTTNPKNRTDSSGQNSLLNSTSSATESTISDQKEGEEPEEDHESSGGSSMTSKCQTAVRNMALIYGSLCREVGEGQEDSRKPRKGRLLSASADGRPSVWEQYYGMRPEPAGGKLGAGYVAKATDVPLYPGGRPEADFTLDVPRSELLSKKLREAKRWRCRCRLFASFLGLVFFLLSVMAVSLLLTRGQRMFGSMV